MSLDDISKNSILQIHDQRKSVYEAMADSWKRLIEEFLRVEGIRVLSITFRVKDRASLADKLSRPKKDYKELKDITDIVGLRIVTFFEDDVDQVAAIISREFSLLPEHCVDKRNSTEPDRFGYKSLHYVCELSPLRKGLAENGSFREEKVEIQIRSILQHAWAEIEHDLGYKGSVLLPDQIKRQLSRVAGLLEIADRDFREVRDSSLAYRNRVTEEIKNNETTHIELDSISYAQFVENSPLVLELNLFMKKDLGLKIGPDRAATITIEMLRSVGITSIEKLQHSLSGEMEALKHYARGLFEVDGPTYENIPTAVSLFHLAQLIAFEQGGVSRLAKLHIDHDIKPLHESVENGAEHNALLIRQAGVRERIS